MNITKKKHKQQQKKKENMQQCPICGKATEHQVFIDGDLMLMICTMCGNQLEFRL